MPGCEASVVMSSSKHQMTFMPSEFGDIPHNFNMGWCAALNLQQERGFTHWAMIHSDIRTSPYWLDTLIGEMDRVNADIMTTIIAIKDWRGLTTTGIRHFGLWGSRRYTMREIFQLPETFSIEDTDEPTEILAINTGCWVCRFPRAGWPWKFPGFKNEHRIVWRKGQATPEFDSEDWFFSEWAASQGLRVFATRKAEVFHIGRQEFGNNAIWGMQQTDDWRPKYPAVMTPEECLAEQPHEESQDRPLPAADAIADAAIAGTI